MSHLHALSRLDDTVIARWRRDLAGEGSQLRRHWRTKIGYYRATGQLLETSPAGPLSWKVIVAAVSPKGSRSTFYEVIGAHARHPLIGSLLAAESMDALQLALSYKRSSAVELLIDETKVWSFWPYREGLLEQCRREPALAATPADALLAVLGEWARRHPGLAAALQYSPPACAVEDLLILAEGRLSGMRAVELMASAVQEALAAPPGYAYDGYGPAGHGPGDGPAGHGPAGSGPAWRGPAGHGPASRGPRRDVPQDEALASLADRIYAVTQDAQRLLSAQASPVRQLAARLLVDAATRLA